MWNCLCSIPQVSLNPVRRDSKVQPAFQLRRFGSWRCTTLTRDKKKHKAGIPRGGSVRTKERGAVCCWLSAVVNVLPKRTTDDATTTRDANPASYATARPVQRARRVGDGHGGAVVLVAGRVALASCVTPRGAGANLNASDAAA